MAALHLIPTLARMSFPAPLGGIGSWERSA